jgi:uncharacterized glyoxalase superfamily protein PhnB
MPKVQIYQQPVKGLEGLGNTFRALKVLDQGFGANEKSKMSTSDKNQSQSFMNKEQKKLVDTNNSFQ